MIRWYDYIAAFVTADILLANAKVAFLAPGFVAQTIGGLSVYAVWYIWNEVYCKWRLKQES